VRSEHWLHVLVLSPFVSQKFVMFIAKPNQEDTIMREAHGGRKGNTGHRQALQLE